jgi:hypothetical protein
MDQDHISFTPLNTWWSNLDIFAVFATGVGFRPNQGRPMVNIGRSKKGTKLCWSVDPLNRWRDVSTRFIEWPNHGRTPVF